MMFTPDFFRTTTPTPKRTQRRFRILNGRVIGSQAGFTLIEVIVSLVLLGILVSMGGMAIVQVVKGYSTTRENATVTQKSQLAMSRITREIMELINIPSDATATALPINNSSGNVTIGLDNGAVKMAFGTDPLANGDILIDNISAFTLTYYAGTVPASTWPATNDITTLTAIDVSMQINREGGGVLTFINRVAPKNIKDPSGAGVGAGPGIIPPTAPNYPGGTTGCFVATAAYGDPGHPMVQILRDFRDRYLLAWGGGRWLVEQYYAHGPAAADLIRNRPLAMGAVRGLLAPVVALTFFLVYAPLAIPFIIMISLIFTVTLFSAVRRGVRPLRSGVFGARGSVLIVLIVTMVIMATLGAAMLTMFSASYSNLVYTDQSRKTYYLAESGFRYAASQFLNASGWPAKEAAMTAMNNKTCNLLGGAGSFTTRVYPYWFKSQATAAGATTLTTQVYGTIPAEFTGGFSSGQIQVGSSYYSYTSGSGSGTAITFSGLSPALPTIAAGVDVQPVTQPGSDQSLSKSGSLSLSGTGSGVFPLLNGNFTLNPRPPSFPIGAVFNYIKRIGNTLVNVTLSNGTQNANWTSAVSIPATTKVVLEKFIRLSSTGTLGNTSREVIYNVPVGGIEDSSSGEFGKAKFIDQFTNDASWFTAQGMGTHTVSGGAMQVTSVVDPTGASGLGTFLQGLSGWGGNGFWGFNAFNWGNTDANLAKSWLDASGCLSYDLQVKVKNTGPYFFAGLGFRMANNSDNTDLYQYGVSFVRARQTQGPSWDNPPSGAYSQNSDMAAALIPASFYPGSPETGSVYSCGFLGWQTCRDQYSDPAIILWQRTGPTTGTGAFKLLAYHILTASDGVLTGSSPNFRLKDWSSLMVRLVEGYELPFTRGLVDASSRHLKYGDKISNLAGTKTARVIGTPIITTNWGGTNSIVAAGRLILTNVVGSGFSVNEDIYLVGGTSSAYARAAGAQATTKASYIMVYYSDDKTAVAGNTIQADNTRIGNARDGANFLAGNAWPPDDWTDKTAGLPTATPPGNDYFTLVQWFSTATSPGSQMAPALTTGNWTLGTRWTFATNPNRLQKASGTSSGTAQPNPALAITAGVTYDVSITVTNWGGTGSPRNFTYSLGGVSGGTISANGTYTNAITATGTGNLIFTPTNNSVFRITAVSVIPRITINTPTLDTTADGQGNVASFVPALSTTDLYQAVIKTSALDSKAWTSSSVAADFTGDAIALTTSGCTPSTSGCDAGAGDYTYYDDFGIQLDTKSGAGFLPPIQQ
ncbi:MAG: CFI-box-CTERM domain-containing protein [Smithellaceae bacterium]|nr:CFI-box-CTERM domain-containing protein [Smithellaceae bacterium]